VQQSEIEEIKRLREDTEWLEQILRDERKTHSRVRKEEEELKGMQMKLDKKSAVKTELAEAAIEIRDHVDSLKEQKRDFREKVRKSANESVLHDMTSERTASMQTSASRCKQAQVDANKRNSMQTSALRCKRAITSKRNAMQTSAIQC
jgi:hypothetical protein